MLAPAPPVAPIAAYRIWQAEETLFNKRLDDGITIMGGSIDELYQEEAMAEINARDLPAIWNKMMTFNDAEDPIWCATKKSQFNRELFDPSKQTIRQFIAILKVYQKELKGTVKTIDESLMVEKILESLPEGDNN